MVQIEIFFIGGEERAEQSKAVRFPVMEKKRLPIRKSIFALLKRNSRMLRWSEIY